MKMKKCAAAVILALIMLSACSEETPASQKAGGEYESNHDSENDSDQLYYDHESNVDLVIFRCQDKLFIRKEGETDWQMLISAKTGGISLDDFDFEEANADLTLTSGGVAGYYKSPEIDSVHDHRAISFDEAVDRGLIVDHEPDRDFDGPRLYRAGDHIFCVVCAGYKEYCVYDGGQYIGTYETREEAEEAISSASAVDTAAGTADDTRDGDASDPETEGGMAKQELKYCLDHMGPSIEITPELQLRYNQFLSNFAEQPDFSYTGYRAADLAGFAIQWKDIHESGTLQQAEGRPFFVISHSEINRIIGKLLNTNIEEPDFSDCGTDNRFGGFVEGDQYFQSLGTGETYSANRFAVVCDMHECDNGYLREYVCFFKVYSLDTEIYGNEGISEKQYSLTAEEAEKDPALHCSGEGKALVWLYGPYGADTDCRLSYYETDGE
ncbi:MAG: hypothetical protein K6B72_02565 [Lachnospiraceae bacterium]|nr:hypothetical protein [Lachnospiraceae bacterium]